MTLSPPPLIFEEHCTVLAEWRSGEVSIDDEALDFDWLNVDEVEARDLPMLPSATRIIAMALSKT